MDLMSAFQTLFMSASTKLKLFNCFSIQYSSVVIRD